MTWAEHPRVIELRRRNGIVDFVVDLLDGYTRHRTGVHASLIAYKGILTLFPLLLGATTVLGLLLEDNQTLYDQIVDSALSNIPVIGPTLKDQGQISGNWFVLAIGLGGALWGSLRAFVALQMAFDDIWEVGHERPNFIFQRLRALIGVGVIAGGQAGSIVLAAIVGQAGLPRTGQALITLGGVALNILVVGTMYRFLTAHDVTWRMVWPGTVFTAVLFTALQFAGTLLMGRIVESAGEVYGVFAGLIALGTWISLHALVALLGAEINATLERRRHAGSDSGEAHAAVASDATTASAIADA